MDFLLYSAVRMLVAIVQALPLRSAARLGRVAGALAYIVDARHRRVAYANLRMCFGHEMSETQIKEIARENFRRIGESFACAVKTASMTFEQLLPHVEFVGISELITSATPRSIVAAIGHLGILSFTRGLANSPLRSNPPRPTVDCVNHR